MDFDPKDYTGLVHGTARRLFNRNASIRRSLEMEDLVQELWTIWVKSTRRFKPDYGFAFSTYFVRACDNYAVNFGRRTSQRVAEIIDSVGQEEIEFIGDDAFEGQEENYSRRQASEQILASTDPRVRQMLELMMNEPETLQEEGRAIDAKAAYARSLGMTRPDSGVNLPALFRLMGISRARGYRLIGELKDTIDAQHG